MMQKTRYLRILLCLAFLFLTTSSLANMPNIRVTPLPGTVSLIFDDGPHPSITPKVLAILKQYHIHATFFLIGYRAEKYPNLVKKILADGNTIGTHTLQHADLHLITPEAIHYELNKSRNLLEKISGQKVYCIQPPFMRRSHKLVVEARALNMIVIPKAYDSYDSRSLSIQSLVDRVVSVANSGAIINLHDTNTRTLLALPEIIQKIQAKGLKFSPICVMEKG